MGKLVTIRLHISDGKILSNDKNNKQKILYRHDTLSHGGLTRCFKSKQKNTRGVERDSSALGPSYISTGKPGDRYSTFFQSKTNAAWRNREH